LRSGSGSAHVAFFRSEYFVSFLELLGSEAVAAVYGSIAFGLERHPGRRIAFGALDLGGLGRIIPVAHNSHKNSAIGTTFGLVDQAFLTEEFLLSGRKDEGLVAVSTG